MPGMGGDDLAESALDAISGVLAILLRFGSLFAAFDPGTLAGAPSRWWPSWR